MVINALRGEHTDALTHIMMHKQKRFQKPDMCGQRPCMHGLKCIAIHINLIFKFWMTNSLLMKL